MEPRIESGLCHIEVFKEALHASYERKLTRKSDSRSVRSKDSGCLSIGAIWTWEPEYAKANSTNRCHVRLAFRFKGRRHFSRYRRKYRLLFASRCQCRGRDRKGDLLRAERAEFATVARQCPEMDFSSSSFPSSGIGFATVLKLQPFGSNGVLADAPSNLPITSLFSRWLSTIWSALKGVSISLRWTLKAMSLLPQGYASDYARHRPILFTESTCGPYSVTVE